MESWFTSPALAIRKFQLVPRWNGKKFFKKSAFDQLGLDPMLAVRILKFVDLFFVFEWILNTSKFILLIIFFFFLHSSTIQSKRKTKAVLFVSHIFLSQLQTSIREGSQFFFCKNVVFDCAPLTPPPPEAHLRSPYCKFV